MDKEITAEINSCTTFGDLLEVLKKHYDTNFTIPFIVKFGLSQQLPTVLKPFKRNANKRT